MLKPIDFFTLLSDETRLRCLALLHQKGELCVCELTDTLKMIQPKISRHLALLRKYKIVNARRRGVWMYYRINDNLPAWSLQVIANTTGAIKSIKPYSSDIKLLSKVKIPDNCCK